MRRIEIRTVDVVQYIHPLREGGSLPAIVEASDGFLYVIKFRGAGQGKKALISELIGGELARAIGFRMPELVFMNLDDSFSRAEPDEEIQDLLKFSIGLNIGLHFLSGAITFDPLVFDIDPLEASKLLILDSMIMNIDRTVKNTNLLDWNKELWLIDHGASLYFHHNWANWTNYLDRPFDRIKDHVLLTDGTQLELAKQQIIDLQLKDKMSEIISIIPDDWLMDENDGIAVEDKRQRYVQYLHTKLDNLDSIIKSIQDVQ